MFWIKRMLVTFSKLGMEICNFTEKKTSSQTFSWEICEVYRTLFLLLQKTVGQLLLISSNKSIQSQLTVWDFQKQLLAAIHSILCNKVHSL